MINVDEHFSKGSAGHEIASQALSQINQARDAGFNEEADRLETSLEASIINLRKSKGKDVSGFNTVLKSIGGLAPQVQAVAKEKNETNQVARRLDANMALFKSRGGAFTEEQISAISKAAEVGDKDLLSTFNDFVIDQNKSLTDLDTKKAEEVMKASMTSTEKPKKTVGDISFEQNATAALRYANELEDAIKQYGTTETYSSAGSAKLAQLPYQMAIAYAKTVDPTSVAREGEVDAAKKYLIPMGAFTRNDTALAAASEFKKDIQKRIDQYKQSTGADIKIAEEPTTPETKPNPVKAANDFFKQNSTNK